MTVEIKTFRTTCQACGKQEETELPRLPPKWHEFEFKDNSDYPGLKTERFTMCESCAKPLSWMVYTICTSR